MRFRWLSVVTAMSLTLLLPAAAAAQPVVYVYHGTLTDAQINDCDGTDVPVPTRGKWTATISPGMAQIDATEFHDWGDGWVHWMAMGGAVWGKWTVIAAEPGSFHLSTTLEPGAIQVDAYLSDGMVRWHLAPYPPCGSADVFGVVRSELGN